MTVLYPITADAVSFQDMVSICIFTEDPILTMKKQGIAIMRSMAEDTAEDARAEDVPAPVPVHVREAAEQDAVRRIHIAIVLKKSESEFVFF